MGVGLVAVGSSYYHWRPNNARLVWDRLPMTVGFMSLIAVVLSETLDVAGAWPGDGAGCLGSAATGHTRMVRMGGMPVAVAVDAVCWCAWCARCLMCRVCGCAVSTHGWCLLRVAVVGPCMLVGLVGLGASSVVYWAVYDDLRFYALVQIVSIALVPLVLALFESRFVSSQSPRSHVRSFRLVFCVAVTLPASPFACLAL